MNRPTTQLHRSLQLSIFLIALLLALPAIGQEGEELIEERTAFTKTYANPDGTSAVQFGQRPTHYLNPETWTYVEIDPTLIAEGSWLNETNSFPIRLPQTLGDGAFIELGRSSGCVGVPARSRLDCCQV